MSRQIDYYFSTVSPWAFIGHKTLIAVAQANDAKIAYRPVRLMEVFDRTGTLRPADRPQARKDYRMLELQRWREKRGLDFKLTPAHWPFDFALADKLVIAIEKSGGDPNDFVASVFDAIWSKERNLADEGELTGHLNAAGLDARAMMAAAKTDAVDKTYQSYSDDAVSLGVFGVPSYVLNGEVFWGQDRLDLVGDALKSGRAAYTL